MHNEVNSPVIIATRPTQRAIDGNLTKVDQLQDCVINKENEKALIENVDVDLSLDMEIASVDENAAEFSNLVVDMEMEIKVKN